MYIGVVILYTGTYSTRNFQYIYVIVFDFDN